MVEMFDNHGELGKTEGSGNQGNHNYGSVPETSVKEYIGNRESSDSKQESSGDKGTEQGADGTERYKCGIPQDWLAVVCIYFIRMGDHIEFYLPAVVTQQVSCDLGISRTDEGILVTSMYVFQLISNVGSHFLAEKFGRKAILLVSLYSSILVTILSALVPNYYMLLVSRSLIGLAIGLCDSTVPVYCSEVMHSKKFVDIGSLAQAMASAIGAGWVGILGYFVLESLNWRFFIVLTSVPFFIPAIILLHFCLPETKRQTESPETAVERCLTKTEVKWLTLKIAIIGFVMHFHGHGIIMLLPNLMREEKTLDTAAYTDNPCHMVKGTDLLVIGAVSGGGNIVGRVLGFVCTRHKVHFKTYMYLTTCVTFLCYCSMLVVQHNMIVYGVVLGVIKLSFGFDRMVRYVVQYDADYFGDMMSISSMWIVSLTSVAVIVSNALPEFSNTLVTIIGCVVLCVVKGVSVCTINELKQG